MNKIDDAWAILKKLPAREQELAAEAILDFAAQKTGPWLTEEQKNEVESRLRETNPSTVTSAELHARLRKLRQ